MACSCICSINVCIHCLFVLFAPNLMIPPSVFDGKDGFATRHGIKTSCHFLVLGWELTHRSVSILD